MRKTTKLGADNDFSGQALPPHLITKARKLLNISVASSGAPFAGSIQESQRTALHEEACFYHPIHLCICEATTFGRLDACLETLKGLLEVGFECSAYVIASMIQARWNRTMQLRSKCNRRMVTTCYQSKEQISVLLRLTTARSSVIGTSSAGTRRRISGQLGLRLHKVIR